MPITLQHFFNCVTSSLGDVVKTLSWRNNPKLSFIAAAISHHLVESLRLLFTSIINFAGIDRQIVEAPNIVAMRWGIAGQLVIASDQRRIA